MGRMGLMGKMGLMGRMGLMGLMGMMGRVQSISAEIIFLGKDVCL